MGKPLRFFRDLYDPKLWGEYKIELNRRDNLANLILRYPQQSKMPFRVVMAECPLMDEPQWLDDASVCRLSFYYAAEVKRELGDEGMLESAAKRYGHAPKMLTHDQPAGFYKVYQWHDEKTRIELGLGHQYDRLQFVDTTKMAWQVAQPARQDKKVRPSFDLF